MHWFNHPSQFVRHATGKNGNKYYCIVHAFRSCKPSLLQEYYLPPYLVVKPDDPNIKALSHMVSTVQESYSAIQVLLGCIILTYNTSIPRTFSGFIHSSLSFLDTRLLTGLKNITNYFLVHHGTQQWKTHKWQPYQGRP